MKLLLTIGAVAFFLINCVSQPTQVSKSGRYLEDSSGKPFFYLGDTAWELFHRLSRSEADQYLEDRAAKGFTVIQAVVLAQLAGLSDPNSNGDLPLINQNPAKPNEAYFKHVDYVVKKAESLSLTIGMLPTWGSYWSSLNPSKVIFDEVNAHKFGEFLGDRYSNAPVIWILGGDHNILNETDRLIVESMADGIRKADTGNHLITFHPRGPGLSSDYFHDAEWLDFNMTQSSHGSHDHDNGLYAEHDYGLDPIKPTIDGEPRYERMPVGFYFKDINRMDRFDDYDARQAAYWSVLAGACGHTYGHHSIWQMYDPKHETVIDAKVPWNKALNAPGAFQMTHFRTLFEARPFHKITPAQELILSGSTSGGAKIRAAIDQDQEFMIVYSPRGEKFTVDKTNLKGNQLRAAWYDPRYGVSYQIWSGDTKGIQTYTPPTAGRGQDWVLLIESANVGDLPGYSN